MSPNQALSEVDIRYDRLSAQAANRQQQRVLVVDAPASSEFAGLVKSTLKEKEAWQAGPTDDLQRLLWVVLTDLRGYLTEGDLCRSHWEGRHSEFLEAFRKTEQLLPHHLREKLLEIEPQVVPAGISSSQSLADSLIQTVGDNADGTVLVFEKPRLATEFEAFQSATVWAEKLRVARKTKAGSLSPSTTGQLIFLGPPHRFVSKGDNDPFLRSLLFSGLTQEVVFLAHRWSCYEQDKHAISRIFPKVLNVSPPETRLIFSANVPSPLSTEEPENESEDIFELPDSIGFKTPTLQRGSVPCRILNLGSQFAFPVEEDASKVTTLTKNLLSGLWEVDSKHPFDELDIGDLVLAKLDSSETEALRQRAQTAMGSRFDLYQENQKAWKRRLGQKLSALKETRVIHKLRALGVSAHSRVPTWVDAELIAPQSHADFRALLGYLQFDEPQIQTMMGLVREYRAHLIAEGLRPGREIAELLNDQERDESFFSHGRTVLLEELGNARFLVAPLASVSEVVLECDPSQLRSVVARLEAYEK